MSVLSKTISELNHCINCPFSTMNKHCSLLQTYIDSQLKHQMCIIPQTKNSPQQINYILLFE